MSEELTEEITRTLLTEPVLVTVLNQEGDAIETAKSHLWPHPYDFDPSPFLPNEQFIGLSEFYALTARIIERAQYYEGVAERKRIPFIEWNPPEQIAEVMVGGELITYRCIRRGPADMDASGTGRVQRAATFSYDLQSPEQPNKVIVVDSRPIDHILEFSCWGKTNKEASARALWLEKTLISQTWVYQQSGVERFFWKERGPDTYVTSNQQRLFYRPLQFFVRMREFEIKAHPSIQEIEILASLMKQGA